MTPLRDPAPAGRRALHPRSWYSDAYPGRPFYPYQLEIATAVERAVVDRAQGPGEPWEFTVEIARQGGKNEASARLEVRLMCRFRGYRGIKVAPTFHPQLLISRNRLEETLELSELTRSRWRPKQGNKIALGSSWQTFLSCKPGGTTREGDTAKHLLEGDEAQDLDSFTFEKSFGQMLLTTGATTVFWGVAWRRGNHLQRTRERLRAEQKRRGRQLVFRYPWDVVAEQNPHYAQAAAKRLTRLGDTHPIWLGHFCLRDVDAVGRFFTARDLDRMMGAYPRRFRKRPGEVIVMGVDLCGADEESDETLLDPDRARRRDSTCITVASCKFGLDGQARLQVLDHLWLPGQHPDRLHKRLCRFMKRWDPDRVVVDARGVGDGPAKKLEAEFPGTVVALKSGVEDVTRMGFALMAAVKTGRLQMYRAQDLDGPADLESKTGPTELELLTQFWLQMEFLERELLPGERVRWHAPTTLQVVEGVATPVHDDFPKSLGYVVEAAERHLTGPVPGTDDERDFDGYTAAQDFDEFWEDAA